jgi:hypothetical protein
LLGESFNPVSKRRVAFSKSSSATALEILLRISETVCFTHC